MQSNIHAIKATSVKLTFVLHTVTPEDLPLLKEVAVFPGNSTKLYFVVLLHRVVNTDAIFGGTCPGKSVSGVVGGGGMGQTHDFAAGDLGLRAVCDQMLMLLCFDLSSYLYAEP